MARKKKSFHEFYTTVPESGCWLWTGFWEPDGYGWLNNKRAHRISWEFHFGKIPDGLHVCHKCDTRACVNPDHLFLGTNTDNTRDKVRKGRQVFGEGHVISKLTNEVACKIASDKRVARVIASEHGISISTVYDVKSGHTWSHATGIRGRQ